MPLSLLIAILVDILCQVYKFFFYSIRDKKIGWHYLVTAGGFPSAHSAFVTALSVTVGVRNGFHSDLFSVSVVFALIVIYDAYRLRGTVQQQSKVINKMAENVMPAIKRLNELVGHSIGEIVAGVFVGGGLALLLTRYLFTF